MVIRVEDSAAKVVDLTPDGISYSVDDWYWYSMRSKPLPILWLR